MTPNSQYRCIAVDCINIDAFLVRLFERLECTSCPKRMTCTAVVWPESFLVDHSHVRTHAQQLGIRNCIFLFTWVYCTVGCGDNAVRLFEGGQPQSAELSGSGDHGAAAFQLALTKQQAHNADVNCVRWSPKDPTLLATAGDDNTIRLWRYRPDPDGHVVIE